MQQVGFTFDFLIFLFGAIFFKRLQRPGAPIAAFQFMYREPLIAFSVGVVRFLETNFFRLPQSSPRSGTSSGLTVSPSCEYHSDYIPAVVADVRFDILSSVAAEAYPASIRSTAHGFSAACGKLGALLPAVLYNYIDNRECFDRKLRFFILSLFSRF
jgi:hypothetical protein